tara:strand:+ start:7616 stop:8623 length:1008 start_codon:yes stop_codon:yes gene_type:complete
MNNSKIFIGPMSKNIVDTVCEYSNKNNIVIGIIPSRRQIEYNGGYVNKWTTKQFINYVRNKSKNVVLQRDHAGPLQGSCSDDGKKSVLVDSKCSFDLIHIDPWKKYKDIDEAAESTSELIKASLAINKNINYEVGTEAAIRKYTPQEFERFLFLVHKKTGTDFKKIKYAVVQGGTKIIGNKNTGTLNVERCSKMIEICKSFNLLSKEHNGDYLNFDNIKQRFELGLDAINIAPEFGFIETQTILDELFNNLDEVCYNKFYNVCYQSNKWKKWFSSDIQNKPEDIKKIAILRAAGHYVFANEEIIAIKNLYPDLDCKIKNNISKKIDEILKAIKNE